MDINKVQKLNRLALDLKKYNLDSDNQQNGVLAAEKIYGEENNFITKHGLEKKDENMENYDRELRNLAIGLKNNEERTNQIIVKINEMIKEFNELKESIKSIRTNIDNISRQAAKETENLKNAEVRYEEQTQPAKKAAAKPIDRNGVAPSEISIDKYFYCGKK